MSGSNRSAGSPKGAQNRSRDADAGPDRTAGARSANPRRPPWLFVLIAGVVVILLLGVALTRDGGGGEDGSAAASKSPPVTTGQKADVAPPERGPVTGVERRKSGDPLAIGRTDAPVVMVEYGDFRCPFCGKFARETQPRLIDRYVKSGILRIEWRDFAIFGKQSDTAAYAARAAARQGRFWQFHDATYATASGTGHPDLPTSALLAAAKEAGVPDLARLKTDMASASLRSEVDADRDEALRIGASSTPAFVVNGTPVLGAQPLEAFEDLIDRARGSAR